MYGKWVRTSWANQEPIAVIERDGSIAGYFAFVMDEALSRATKYIYGRMTSLAIDASCRGQGVGASLFGSVIGMIGAMGGGYVASEYSVKNHASASLHSRSRFRNVHEKVLFHLWL